MLRYKNKKILKEQLVSHMYKLDNLEMEYETILC